MTDTPKQQEYKKLPELHVVGRIGSIYAGALLGAGIVLLVLASVYWSQKIRGAGNAND